MIDYIHYALSVFMGFFAIMNPIANVPIFLSLTAGDDDRETAAIARHALFLAFAIVAAFCVGGNLIFKLFGLTLPAFRITGGFLVFLIGFHMLQGNQSKVQNPSEDDKRSSQEAELSVAVSPLAMPILAGPGTITTAMSFSAGVGAVKLVIALSVFALLCVITYAFFMFGEKFVTYIGKSALGVITRMMGLLLAVMGTQMTIEGLKSSF